MSKILYAPRETKYVPICEDSYGYDIGGYVADMVDLVHEVTRVYYKNNEQQKVESEIHVKFPRKSRLCCNGGKIKKSEVFESFEQCLAYVQKLNEKHFEKLIQEDAQGFIVLDAHQCKLDAEKEQELANEYINSNTFNV